MGPCTSCSRAGRALRDAGARPAALGRVPSTSGRRALPRIHTSPRRTSRWSRAGAWWRSGWSASGFGPWSEVWSSRAAGGRWTEPARASRFKGETVPLFLRLAATAASSVAFYRLSSAARTCPTYPASSSSTTRERLWSRDPRRSTHRWRCRSCTGGRSIRSRRPTRRAPITVAPGRSSSTRASREARFRVLARRFAPANGGWSAPAIVEDTRGNVRDSYEPHVAASAAGDAILVWVEHGVPFTLRASAFVPGRGWKGPRQLTRADR